MSEYGRYVKSHREPAAGLSKSVIDRIEGGETIWEREPMEGLAADGQLTAYMHDGFWRPMDTLRDRNALEELWDGGIAPWKIW